MPLRFAVFENAIPRATWEAIDPRDIEKMKTTAIPPKPPTDQPQVMHLVYSPDRSSFFENPYFAQTQEVRSDAGVMVFVSGSSALQLEQGWQILGDTYHEVWSSPEKLALYNSIFPPDEKGRPRAFGYFAGNESAMLSGAPFSPAPVTRPGDIIEFQVPKTPPQSVFHRLLSKIRKKDSNESERIPPAAAALQMK